MSPFRSTPSRILAILTLMGLALGCGNETDIGQGKVLKSEQQRITTPQVDQAQLHQLSSANTAFGMDLHGVLLGLLSQDENLFLLTGEHLAGVGHDLCRSQGEHRR